MKNKKERCNLTKQSKKRRNRVKNLIVVCSLSAIVLIVSTYAWFIGLQAVNVTSFDVEIASAESLLLSLDGQRWSSTVSISKATLDEFHMQTIQITGLVKG